MFLDVKIKFLGIWFSIYYFLYITAIILHVYCIGMIFFSLYILDILGENLVWIYSKIIANTVLFPALNEYQFAFEHSKLTD